MATPAQVANDMEAQARYWQKRDKVIARACADSARVIRAFIDNEHVDGRTYGGLHRRLLDLVHSRRGAQFNASPNFDRALSTLQQLNGEACQK